MKNQGQANNRNSVNDPTVANHPQDRVEFDDLPVSREQEKRVNGGTIVAVNGGGNTPQSFAPQGFTNGR